LVLDLALRGVLGGSIGGLERENHRAFADLVADGHLELADLARGGRRHLHRRLVGLQNDERVLDGDLVAGRDKNFDDGYGVEVADVRDLDFHHKRTLRRSDSWLTRCATKRAASAPSITRWS